MESVRCTIVAVKNRVCVDLFVFVENGILERLTKPASETHTREQKHILERRNGKSFIQTSNTFMYIVHGYHQRSRWAVVA